jgi:predicted TIM-barrel fold metal-dependent hydrolase
MSTVGPRTIGDIETTVVDGDFHLTDQFDDIAPYLDRPWSEALRGATGEFYDPMPRSGIVPIHQTSGRVQSPDVRTREDVLEGMELLSVDRPIVTPGGRLLRLGMTHHDEVAPAIAKACNSFVLDKIVDVTQHVYAALAIAGQNPTKAAEEIDDRADESGIVAAYLPSGGLNPPLGHRRYDPIYDACERAGLPLMMHGVSGGTMKSFPVQFDTLPRAMANHALSHPFQHMVNIASMLINGIPERFPDLDFVFQESGLGWIPFLMYRLDHDYYPQPEDAPLLEKLPSEYMKEDFYYTSQPVEGLESNPEYVCQIARLMGAEHNLLFASDYPHHDFDHSDAVLRVLSREFDTGELERIYGKNAEKVFFD